MHQQIGRDYTMNDRSGRVRTWRFRIEGYFNYGQMKKNAINKTKTVATEQGEYKQEREIRTPRSGNLWGGIRGILEAWKKKRFIHFRRKVTNKDGSVVETEFIYRDDT